MGDYKVSQVKLESVNYMLRILQIPPAEANDKLTYFSRERGLISKFLYEDFLIVVCIPEVHAFVQQLQQLGVSKEEFVRIRAEAVAKVLEVNPVFNPENLIINSNQVLKVCGGPQELADTHLIENSHWNKDPMTQPVAPIEDKRELDKSKLQLKDLSYTKKQQYWRRLGQYITVKYFDPGSEAVILGNKQFTTRHAFEQYVVAVCIDEVEDLFTRIDKMNLRISPPVLVHELYELCQKANPNLNYDVFKDMTSPSDEAGAVDPFESLQAAAGEGPEKPSPDAQEKGRVKSFRQVKKEKLLSINDDIKKKVVGQDVAIDTLIEAIQRASVGLRDPNQPIGSFIFTGYTGVGKCVEKGTLVFSNAGIRPIENFYYDSNTNNDQVFVYGNGGPHTASHIYKEGIKPGRRIITDTGGELGGSLIHPVIVINNDGNVVFKKFHELTIDDYVAVQYNQNYFSQVDKKLDISFINELDSNVKTSCFMLPTHMTYDLAFFIGMLIGDGGLTADGRISFSNTDRQLVRKFYDLSKSLFNITPKYTKIGCDYYFDSKYVYNFLKYACGVGMTKSIYKEIPQTILESTKDSLIGFIQGLMDTDGYFEKNGVVGITLSSKKLINQLQIVLLDFGIVSFIRHKLVPYNCSFKNAWALSIRSDFARRFFERIGFTLRRKQDKYNLIYNKIYNPNKDIIPNIHLKLRSLVEKTMCYTHFDRKFHRKYAGYMTGMRKPSRNKLSEFLSEMPLVSKNFVEYKELFNLSLLNVYWSKINNIVDLMEMDLYDFTVPENHTFISNGFISHNTYTAKVLAEELLGSRNGLVIVDCSEYAADHEYAKLIGAPSGYIGHEHGGYLTNAVKKNPFSIVLFDEIEKASEKVHQLMLQIMDEARLTDGKGVLVPFKDIILVMTSNVGVKETQAVEKTIGFGNASELNKDKRDKALKEALKSKFKPEFLNRITDIVHFDPLNKNDYFKIIKLELDKLKRNLRLNQTEYSKLDLKFDKSLYNYIYKTGIDEKLGARPLIRAIEREISNPLARKLLKESVDCATTKITMRAKNNKVVIDSECTIVDSGTDAPPFYMRAGLE